MSSNQATLINNGTVWGSIFQSSPDEPHLVGTLVHVPAHLGLVQIRGPLSAGGPQEVPTGADIRKGIEGEHTQWQGGQVQKPGKPQGPKK